MDIQNSRKAFHLCLVRSEPDLQLRRAQRARCVSQFKMVITQNLDEIFIVTGQFAEVAYCGRIINVELRLLFDNIDTLLRPDFLLEGYTAIRGAVLVSHFKGSIADLPAYVVYRPSTKQLIVGISGTTSMKHAYHDLRATKARHPSGRGLVHSGFWSLYQGIKPTVLDAIATGLRSMMWRRSQSPGIVWVVACHISSP
jgi:hypothetical protein